jgi:hypothetical protein
MTNQSAATDGGASRASVIFMRAKVPCRMVTRQESAPAGGTRAAAADDELIRVQCSS